MATNDRYLSLGWIRGGPQEIQGSSTPRELGADLGIELTPDEYERISEGLDALDRLRTPIHYSMLERNFGELENRFRFTTVVLSLERKLATPDRRSLAENLWIPLVNWLASMRTFLDHAETGLKRRFGGDSHQAASLKAATSTAYDDHLGYRFTYRLRNYAQHCELPTMTVKSGRQPGEDSLSVPPVRLHLDRDALLAGYDSWGPVRADLEALPESFDLLPLAKDAMDGIRKVYRVCLSVALDDAVNTSLVVSDALDRLPRDTRSGETPALFSLRIGSEAEISQFSPRPIPVAAIDTLHKVASGEVDRESLWREAGPPPPPPLDPVNVRERFHRDSRGVQVLSEWFTGGGSTDRLQSLVMSIIDEDGGVEPLLNGLIESSALLAHMTAGAIGASPESIVVGILDLYNEFDG